MSTYSNQASATYTAGIIPKNTASNTVTAMSAEPNFPLVKTQTNSVLFSDTVQEYTVTGQNNTGVGVLAFILTDVIPVGLAYVAGSFKVDGVTEIPVVVGNSLTYTFGAWASGDTHAFSFQCIRSV